MIAVESGKLTGTSTETRRPIDLCERLPAEKREEVLDFARFLLARQKDAAWEATVADPHRRPKLGAFVRDALEKPSEPLTDASFLRNQA